MRGVFETRRLPHFFCVDLTQAWYGKLDDLDRTDAGQRIWPPPIVIEYYSWWCKAVDPLLAANPLWYVRVQPAEVLTGELPAYQYTPLCLWF